MPMTRGPVDPYGAQYVYDELDPEPEPPEPTDDEIAAFHVALLETKRLLEVALLEMRSLE